MLRFKGLMLGIAGGLLVFGASAAQAQVTVTLPSPTPIQTPGFTAGYSQFTYSVSTDAVTHLVPGNSFTIMDIGGLFDAVAPANFTVSAINTGLGDVTFTYTGPTTATAFSETGFEINTSPGFAAADVGAFSATGTNGSGGAVSDSGAVGVPTAGAAGGSLVPLPPALYAFPLALVLAGFAYRRMSRTA